MKANDDVIIFRCPLNEKGLEEKKSKILQKVEHHHVEIFLKNRNKLMFVNGYGSKGDFEFDVIDKDLVCLVTKTKMRGRKTNVNGMAVRKLTQTIFRIMKASGYVKEEGEGFEFHTPEENCTRKKNRVYFLTNSYVYHVSFSDKVKGDLLEYSKEDDEYLEKWMPNDYVENRNSILNTLNRFMRWKLKRIPEVKNT